MKILADYHHGGLYHSLHLLFEKRLGWELYRPIGLDWFSNGYWRIAEPYNNAQDTINQYLSISNQHWDSFKCLNGDYVLNNEIYHIFDGENKFHHKAITLETFKKWKFDAVISTYPSHDKRWKELKDLYQPQAKYVVQIGNEGQTTDESSVLTSSYAFRGVAGQKVCFYHQEFETELFSPKDEADKNTVTSFVVLLPERELYLKYQMSLPEFTFKAYGPGAIDGNLGTKELLASTMRSSMWGWHVKPADGYGHIIHNWYACGRPIITRGNYYAGKTGGLLLEDQKTCIDLDKHSFEDNLMLIRYWSKPENYKTIRQNAINRFKEVVDFNKEASRVKEFLSII